VFLAPGLPSKCRPCTVPRHRRQGPSLIFWCSVRRRSRPFSRWKLLHLRSMAVFINMSESSRLPVDGPHTRGVGAHSRSPISTLMSIQVAIDTPACLTLAIDVRRRIRIPAGERTNRRAVDRRCAGNALDTRVKPGHCARDDLDAIGTASPGSFRRVGGAVTTPARTQSGRRGTVPDQAYATASVPLPGLSGPGSRRSHVCRFATPLNHANSTSFASWGLPRMPSLLLDSTTLMLRLGPPLGGVEGFDVGGVRDQPADRCGHGLHEDHLAQAGLRDTRQDGRLLARGWSVIGWGRGRCGPLGCRPGRLGRCGVVSGWGLVDGGCISRLGSLWAGPRGVWSSGGRAAVGVVRR